MKRMKTALRRFSEEESLPSYEDSHPLETKVQVKMVESFEKSHALQNAVWRGVFSILLFSFVGFFIYSAHRQSVFPWDVVAETRFASHTIILRRLVRVKEALCQMVISNTWGGWRQADIEKAKIVKDLIFSDDFWNRVEYALELTESIMSMLWYADTDEPCLGNIYDAMDSMLEIMKLKYHAYFMDEVDSETVIIADWLAAVSFLMATVGLLWKTKFHVYWLLCSSAIGLLLACFWMYHMLRLSTFRWDVIWLPLGPLSCGGLCIYVDRLLSEALEDIKRLRASIYHFKRN